MAGNFDRKLRLPHTHFRVLLHAANMRHGEGRGAEDFFFHPEKNPTASAGFEPAKLGTKGQHATTRPQKPLFTIGKGKSKAIPL